MQRNLFRHGVGGHDGPCGLFATGQPAGHLVDDLGDTCQHLVHRQPVADEPSGTHGYLDRPGLGAPVGERRGDGLCGGVGVLKAHRPGAGVGTAGVEHDCAQTSGGEHLLRPQHRRGLDLVAGEHGRGGVVGTLVEHQREVERTGSLDARGDSGGPETGGRGHTLGADEPRSLGGIRIGHGATPTIESPSVSGQPSARFIDCTAAPPVPLTRLSIAAMPMKVEASSSTATAS